MIERSRLKDPKLKHSFDREIQLTKSFNHPNLMKLYEKKVCEYINVIVYIFTKLCLIYRKQLGTYT